jgi:hypothetical protein
MDEEIESEQEKMAQMNLMQQAQAAALGSQPMQPAQGINNTSTAPQQ